MVHCGYARFSCKQSRFIRPGLVKIEQEGIKSLAALESGTNRGWQYAGSDVQSQWAESCLGQGR